MDSIETHRQRPCRSWKAVEEPLAPLLVVDILDWTFKARYASGVVRVVTRNCSNSRTKANRPAPQWRKIWKHVLTTCNSISTRVNSLQVFAPRIFTLAADDAVIEWAQLRCPSSTCILSGVRPVEPPGRCKLEVLQVTHSPSNMVFLASHNDVQILHGRCRSIHAPRRAQGYEHSLHSVGSGHFTLSCGNLLRRADRRLARGFTTVHVYADSAALPVSYVFLDLDQRPTS